MAGVNGWENRKREIPRFSMVGCMTIDMQDVTPLANLLKPIKADVIQVYWYLLLLLYCSLSKLKEQVSNLSCTVCDNMTGVCVYAQTSKEDWPSFTPK